MTILEVWITRFKLELYEHVIVLVVEETESIALKHFTVRHAAVAKVNL